MYERRIAAFCKIFYFANVLKKVKKRKTILGICLAGEMTRNGKKLVFGTKIIKISLSLQKI
jgi:hypothetical protein